MMEALRLYGTLRFVEDAGEYSVYEDCDGEEVYLAHGTGKMLVSLDEIDVGDRWSQWIRQHGRTHFTADLFLDMLRESVIDPEEVDEITVCAKCVSPAWSEDMHGTNDGMVCDSCITNYWWCNDCEEYFDETTTTLNDTEVCDRCRGRNWSYCEDCEGYYPDHCAGEHEHNQGNGCCESPAQAFSVRNNGDGTLRNDTRATVALPAGIISDEGIGAIGNYLRTYAYTVETDPDAQQKLRTLAYSLGRLGPEWQSKEGNFTKRLSKMAYKEHGYKVKPEMMSMVGSIAREHSTAIDFAIEVTRDLNLGPDEFAHEESCWWQSYYASRCALKTNGGFGLRTFSTHDSYGGGTYECVEGRAWVMPLKKDEDGRLLPTFETLNPDAFVVFNGYGDLSGYVPARIVSHMAGMTYRKIVFECTPMYVNSESGYLVAPEEIAEGYTDGALYLSVEQHSNLFDREKKVLAHV